MSLLVRIPDTWEPVVIDPPSIEGRRTTRYFVYKSNGKRKEFTAGTARDTLNTALEIGKGPPISNEKLLCLNVIKLACLSGSINKAIKSSTKLFGGHKEWDKLQEWQRMKEKEE